jgi:hypothetical protein
MTPAKLNLKAAHRRLVAGLGGVDGAETATSRRRSVLADYGNINTGHYTPIDVVLDLEAALGEPVVTRELARAAGFRLEPLVFEAAALDPLARAASLAADAGELCARALRDHADGTLTEAERQGQIKVLRRIEQAAAVAIAVLSGLKVED